MALPSDAEPKPDRQVAPALVHALLTYVGEAGGAEALAAVAAAVDEAPDELFSDRRWFSSAEAIAIAEAAARVCHDEHIGVRAGEQLWATLCAHDGYLDLVRSAGTLNEAMAAAATRGSKISTGRLLSVVSAGVDEVTLVGRYSDLTSAHRFYCGFAAGFYGQLPRAFGMVATAVELHCQLDGADECAYRIRWRSDTEALAPDAAELSDSSDRVQRQLDQLEQVHQLTSQLLSADRVHEVLERITSEAGRAVQAPRYLLAVRVNERDRLRVHERGFRKSAVDAFAHRLLAGEVGEADGVLYADVANGEHHYGRLAACYPRGSVFADADRRLLRAYARHAAAVLRHVASLEQAATDRDTARALLDLARSIAGAGTVVDVARRLVDTVPRVVDCDTAALWVWDPETGGLVLAAYADAVEHTGFVGPHRLAAAELQGVEEVVANPSPRVLDAATAGEPVRSMLTAVGVAQVAVVPVTSHGDFAGIVCAGFRRELPEEQMLFARLAGLADHAAIALQSVRLVEQISHHASHDALTGLANRNKLREDAEDLLRRARRTKSRAALLFIDLDRFKNVNDTLGHGAGDDLIRQAAQRIRDVITPGDVLARLGGDEFLLVLPDIADVAAAEATAQTVVDALRRPFTLERQDVYISCSVGVACYPDHGREYSTLLKHADVAMYAAKAGGRNTVATYTERRAAPRPAGIALEAQLHAALETDEIDVFYQPQFDLHDGSIVAAEALVRWRHPQYGLLEPASFIALAEESGLIADVDERVRAIAFAQAGEWRDSGHPLRIAVNVSARDLHDPGFVQRLLRQVSAAGLAADAVEVEITERVAMHDDALSGVLNELYTAGLRVAIDDFGTGSSVLGRLHRCPVHTLKIDRSFLRDVRDDGQEPVVVAALVSLARTMGLTTVVEGVENVDQLNAVRACGADVAQGFLLARPGVAAGITALLNAPASITPALLRSQLPHPRRGDAADAHQLG